MCIKINVKKRNKQLKDIVISIQAHESLLEALIRNNCMVQSVCGGNGRCGKCKVQICEAEAAITAKDAALLSKEELAEGWRLACALYPDKDMTVLLDTREEAEFEIVSGYSAASMNKEQAVQANAAEEYQLAVDIGTTTLVFQLLEKNQSKIVHTITSLNSQRKYGADVISRIQAATQGKAEELRACIRKDLQAGIEKLTEECCINIQQIKQIVIAGNTTMIHLLQGYDCSGLGRYPFTPVNIDLLQENAENLIGENRAAGLAALKEKTTEKSDAKAVILPGISAFVGGDIVSGLYACDFAENDEICLFIDLGTNAEIALGNKDKVLVTSAAAGPAFEGGNISWGMGSVAGAICSVMIDSAGVKVKTIRDEVPCGICGTGVVEAVAELIRKGYVDETGLLDDIYFDDGFPLAEAADDKWITFTQKDVREIQLAKAAIRAGIETLLLRYGITASQVARVYLAGGFGYRLDTKQAVAIGIFPEELSDKIEAVGNSSLAGGVKYLQDEAGDDKLQKIISVSEEITLANDADFNEMYMNAMMFAEK